MRQIVKTKKYEIIIQTRQTAYGQPGFAREWGKTTRVYVDSDVVGARDERYRELAAQEAALGEHRWCQRGEHPEVDRLYDRLNRRHATVAREVAVEALIAANLGGADVKARFSRHAGCSCPCSPGVVVSKRITRGAGMPVDIWIKPLPVTE